MLNVGLTPFFNDPFFYLLKKRLGMSSKEIGLKMGIGASAVGNQWLKIKKRLAEDKELAGKLLKC